MNKDSLTEKIIELEYSYIKDTIHQSIEDRYRLLNFCIGIFTASITVVITVFSISDLSNLPDFSFVIGLFLFMSALTGWVFLIMQIRLRQAWRESLIALNKIKESTIIESTKYFNWSSNTIPEAFRVWSITFFIGLLISVISSASLGGSIYMFFYLVFSKLELLYISIGVFVVNLILQQLFFRIALTKHL